MENVTKDLQLTPEQRTTLLYAVSVFLSKKHIFLYATVQEKLDLYHYFATLYVNSLRKYTTKLSL